MKKTQLKETIKSIIKEILQEKYATHNFDKEVMALMKKIKRDGSLGLSRNEMELLDAIEHAAISYHPSIRKDIKM